MFKTALRVARPVALAVRTSNRRQASRAFSTTSRVSSGGPPPPELYGPGAKPGTVPTDLDQSTGLERLQLLGETQGINVFDEEPLDSSRIGTKANPVLVPSYVRAYSHFCRIVCLMRFIGCRTHYWMHWCSCGFSWCYLVQPPQR